MAATAALISAGSVRVSNERPTDGDTVPVRHAGFQANSAGIQYSVTEGSKIMKRHQKGMTLIGFIFVLAIAGVFAYVGMKLFPVYSEYYGVVSAMKGVQAEPGVATMSPAKIRDLLNRRFYISYVTSVKPENIKIDRKDGYNLTVKYEVREPLIYNLDFVAKFEKTVELTRQGGVD